MISVQLLNITVAVQ